ncbi:hypothetical protein HMPREF7215_1465 [Pyramidobacter piscolens W5455]|uniref:Uncharacterized protein n=1 Tax=Pyramidobacter piscolens W5455 TaxID=352165 RepID=A0ABM9ZSJ5_9BACT|nr:hypothetical protein HMPREF7215_1465 [Pyramidobacter piscolens W5455]
MNGKNDARHETVKTVTLRQRRRRRRRDRNVPRGTFRGSAYRQE